MSGRVHKFNRIVAYHLLTYPDLGILETCPKRIPIAVARERVSISNERLGASEKYVYVREIYNTLTHRRFCEDIAGFKVEPYTGKVVRGGFTRPSIYPVPTRRVAL